jgi:hypothetical protein
MHFLLSCILGGILKYTLLLLFKVGALYIIFGISPSIWASPGAKLWCLLDNLKTLDMTLSGYACGGTVMVSFSVGAAAI